MPRNSATLEERYISLAATLLGEAYVRQIQNTKEKRKKFGSNALKVNNKIFAMLTSKDLFVVKLPKARVDVLLEEGAGERFDPGHGRIMKEWLVLYNEDEWLELAREAMKFAGGK